MYRRVAALVLGLAVLLPAVPAAAESEPARPRTGRHELTTGRVAVRYKPGTTAAARRKAARLAGGKVKLRMPKLGVEVLEARDAAWTTARLSARGEVMWAKPEVLARRFAQVAQPERVELNYGPAVTASSGAMRGANVKVAVIDDGVWSVADLAGRLVDRGNCSTGVCFANGAVDAGAGAHGTAVATVIGAADDTTGIVGGAPLSLIHAYRVFPDEQSGASDTAIAAAIVKAADDGVAVANLSLGTPFDSYLLRDAIAYARTKAPDMVLVAAAGNDGSERANYPAGNSTVLSVGATEQTGTTSWPVAGFSTRGDVDVVAPGVNVRAWYTDADAKPPAPSGSCNVDNVSCVAGTSFAAPEVAAILAGLAGAGVTGDRARAAVVASAKPRTASAAPPVASGAGRADALAAYNLATGTAAYTAAFLDRGAMVAATVGRRRVEILRVDPQPGAGADGPAGMTASEGKLARLSSSTSTVGPVAVHRTFYEYRAPAGGAVPRNATLTARATGDAGPGVRTVPIRLLRPTAGPEGQPLANALSASPSLAYGENSSYIRTVALQAGQTLQLRFTYPESSSSSLMFVWLPNGMTNGGMHAAEIPAVADESGAYSAAIDYVAPALGTYTFGFMLFAPEDDGTYHVTAAVAGGGGLPTGTSGRTTGPLRPSV